MRKNGNGRIVLGGSSKIEHLAIHEVLSVEQTEALKERFKQNGIHSHEDLRNCKAVKTAMKQTGFFKDVSSVPGKANNDFKVVLKGSSGKTAQGGLAFAVQSS